MTRWFEEFWGIVVRAEADPAVVMSAVAACGGDACAYGALAGAVCGALRGETAIPASWRELLEDHDAHADLAEQLLARAAPEAT
jgi:ADP-ribosylglycohydrolase